MKKIYMIHPILTSIHTRATKTCYKFSWSSPQWNEDKTSANINTWLEMLMQQIWFLLSNSSHIAQLSDQSLEVSNHKNWKSKIIFKSMWPTWTRNVLQLTSSIDCAIGVTHNEQDLYKMITVLTQMINVQDSSNDYQMSIYVCVEL